MDPHDLRDMLFDHDGERIEAFRILQEKLELSELECCNLVKLIEMGHSDMAYTAIRQRMEYLGIDILKEDNVTEERTEVRGPHSIEHDEESEIGIREEPQ